MQTMTTGERIYGLDDLIDRYGGFIARRAWHYVAMAPDVGAVLIRENLSGRWRQVPWAPGVEMTEESMIDEDIWEDCCRCADMLRAKMRGAR